MAYKTYARSQQGNKTYPSPVTQAGCLGEQVDNDQNAYEVADELGQKLACHGGGRSPGESVYESGSFSRLVILMRERQVVNARIRRVCLYGFGNFGLVDKFIGYHLVPWKNHP